MYIIGNGTIVTRDKDNSVLKDGALAIKDEKILDVGITKEIKKKYLDSEFIDAKGMLIMPGFINCHDHIYSAFSRGISIKGYNPKNFGDILEGMWWNIDNHLSLEMVKYSALYIYLNCVKNGVTTTFDHHASYKDVVGSLFNISKAAEEIGVRTNLCYEISDRNGIDKMKQAVKESVDFIKYAQENNSDMLGAMMGLHASFTVSDKTLNYCNEQKPDDVGYHVHVAEGIQDLRHSLKTYGKRIVDRFYDNDVLGEKTLAVHSIHINSGEMDILKDTNTPVIHNPESNMGNAVGCGSVIEMSKRGMLLGLGTDGYTNDMLESYKVGNILHKHYLCDPTVGWAEMPQMLFNNNATIANRHIKGQVGALKKGAYADVIIADYNPPTPLNESNINGHMLFGMCGKDVSMTMVNGRVLMKDKKLIDIDEKEIISKCRELSQKLWDDINR